jgi:hypothetical protein
MFYHAVLMNLSNTSAEFLSQVDKFAVRVRAELPYVRDYHFGRNVASRAGQFGWTVIAAFDTEADHERYQVSAVHQQMKAFMGPHIAEIVVCDVDTPTAENRDG